MRRIRCFMVEQTGKSRVWWRRYRSSTRETCPSTLSYCNAKIHAGDVDGEVPSRSLREGDEEPGAAWPDKCEACGYIFAPEDERHVFTQTLYREVGTTGPVFALRDAPPGAMWYADWMSAFRTGPDGRNLVVMTPGGEWMIDRRASNCTKPDDDVHRCWVRTGTPPNVTVGKGGVTCSAGAGSIMIRGYHGFLRNGYLED